MKKLIALSVALALVASAGASIDDALDHVSDSLRFSTHDSSIALKTSGTLDLEAYRIPELSNDLIYTEGRSLFAPRMAVFLDAQIGPRIYFFSQARIDRGFDPSDDPLEARLDEYALRLTVAKSPYTTIQVGKFGTVFGNWMVRHGSWENPFITAPLAYGRLTGLWDNTPPFNTTTLLRWSHVIPSPTSQADDKYFSVPVIWGPSYASGASLSTELGPINFAAEIKNTSLSSRPETWSVTHTGFQNPTFTGRLGYHPNPTWHFGLSWSSGTFLDAAAHPPLRAGARLSDYKETVFGGDIAFAWRHWQVWAEAISTKFAIPGVADPHVFSWYVESKYKFTARIFGALRVGQQTYSKIPDATGGAIRWDRDVTAIDFAPTFRLAAHLQAKLQYSLQREEGDPKHWSHLTAAQMTLRF
ncbi:MAG: hypothetical protein QM790_11935 [Nibricoccus sp.]